MVKRTPVCCHGLWMSANEFNGTIEKLNAARSSKVARAGAGKTPRVHSHVLHFVIRNAMPLVSIRLPDDVEARLAREAARLERPKSELARDAIVDYLDRIERERFLGEIARAARARGDDEALAAANEALPTDNEALAMSEGVRKRKASYRATRKRKPRR
jgi:predicted transcriptional regulator